MTSAARTRVRLQRFAAEDLDALVRFWNRAFADRRNFYPLTAHAFRRRILNCPAFDCAGLILAWQETGSQVDLAGLVLAFKPPAAAIYDDWGKHHSIALLYVTPAARGQGIGSNLLRAAENWLYYCPVHFAGQAQPCTGTIEGPRSPFFGSTQRMGVSVRERDLIHFLARRGYAVVDPGDVSMCLPTLPHREPPPAPDLAALGLALWPFDNQAPFTGQETPGREMYTLWGDNGGDAYAGLALVDGAGVLHGHISWYPMVRPGWAAIANFWLSPVLRGRGLGRYLLDLALYEMAHAAPPHGGYHAVEVQTQTVRHPVAVELYQRRGFSVDEAWVNLVKT